MKASSIMYGNSQQECKYHFPNMAAHRAVRNNGSECDNRLVKAGCPHHHLFESYSCQQTFTILDFRSNVPIKTGMYFPIPTSENLSSRRKISRKLYRKLYVRRVLKTPQLKERLDRLKNDAYDLHMNEMVTIANQDGWTRTAALVFIFLSSVRFPVDVSIDAINYELVQ